MSGSLPWLGRRLSLGLCALAFGCAPLPSTVGFRVAVVGDDPFRGADGIELRLERTDGSLIFAEELDSTERTIVLGPLPFATEMTLVVEARIGSLPLAGGRSFPFVVPGARAPPTRSVDVILGLLGRHASVATLASGGPIRAIAATSVGALLATDSELVPLLLHGADGRPLLGAAVELPASRVGGALVAFDGGLLAVGGATPGATLFSAEGSIIAELTSAELRVTDGAALAPLGPASVLVIGGRDATAAILADVVRIERTATGLSATVLEPLRTPRAGARAIALDATSTAGPVQRVLVVDGVDAAGPVDDFDVLDPEGTAPSFAWMPLAVIRGSALATVALGQVVMAGGHDATGAVVGDVRVLFVSVDRPMPLEFLSPAPDPLFRARDGAAALSFAPGAVLVVGGLDGAGAPIDAVELADLRVLPGSVRPTGSLPAAAESTEVAVLDDRSILVAAGDALSLYFPYPL